MRIILSPADIAEALCSMNSNQRAVFFEEGVRQGQTTPTERYTVGPGTVRDNKTGLIWQREVPAGEYTLKDAKKYAAGLQLGMLTGWRLPTITELLTLVDYERYNPAIDPEAFLYTPSDWFWSSSPYANYTTYGAWVVNFYDGNTTAYFTTHAIRVRCVR